MKNSMVRMIKKVTAAVLAAATVMGATVAATPAIVRADSKTFTEDDFKNLPEHPTADMDINVIKNAYFVFDCVGENIKAGDVLYVQANATCAMDGSSPNGTDIVVVIRKYQDYNIFGTPIPKVSCKSLIDGETFDDLVLSSSVGGSKFYEICKRSELGNDTTIRVDAHGLESNSNLLVKAWDGLCSLVPFLGKK